MPSPSRRSNFRRFHAIARPAILALSILLLAAIPAHSDDAAGKGERYPQTAARLLDPSEIAGWSDAKLRYAINEMYARHGVDFKDKEIKKWFQHFPWYHPRSGLDYDDARGKFTEIESRNVALLEQARKAPQSAAAPAAPPQTDAPETAPPSPAAPAVPATPATKAVSASTVDLPPDGKDDGFTAGNIKVVFADGHSEVLTKDGNCLKPRISPAGSVGWIHNNGPDQHGYSRNDVLEIHLPDGTMKKFGVHPEAPFMLDWGFEDNGASVVITSMAHHGSASFIRYDFATGRVTGHVDGYLPPEKMPKWAKPFEDK